METSQDNTKFPTLPNQSLVTIEISGAFYSKIKAVLLHLCSTLPMEETLKILNKLKNNEPVESLQEAEIHVLTALVAAIEQAAKDQNKLEYKDLSSLKEE